MKWLGFVSSPVHSLKRARPLDGFRLPAVHPFCSPSISKLDDENVSVGSQKLIPNRDHKANLNSPNEPRSIINFEGICTDSFTELTYQTLLDKAEKLLQGGWAQLRIPRSTTPSTAVCFLTVRKPWLLLCFSANARRGKKRSFENHPYDLLPRTRRQAGAVGHVAAFSDSHPFDTALRVYSGQAVDLQEAARTYLCGACLRAARRQARRQAWHPRCRIVSGDRSVASAFMAAGR